MSGRNVAPHAGLMPRQHPYMRKWVKYSCVALLLWLLIAILWVIIAVMEAKASATLGG